MKRYSFYIWSKKTEKKTFKKDSLVNISIIINNKKEYSSFHRAGILWMFQFPEEWKYHLNSGWSWLKKHVQIDYHAIVGFSVLLTKNEKTWITELNYLCEHSEIASATCLHAMITLWGVHMRWNSTWPRYRVASIFFSNIIVKKERNTLTQYICNEYVTRAAHAMQIHKT